MKIRYDLHVHSGLSPCADNEMTPVNIVGFCKLNGIDMVAISDHNAIQNVETALKAGEAYGVTVVPAMELQTSEDIHLLCMFETYAELKKFYDSLEFAQVRNKKEIFGEQLIFDEDDNVVGELENLLLTSSTLSSDKAKKLVDKCNGLCIPAHVNREANGMVQILGCVTDDFSIVELANNASDEEIERYREKYVVLIDSDAHTLSQIAGLGEMELEENSVKCLFETLRKNYLTEQKQ